MGQFKPMVKMETTEPSVELKLAKGGAVKMKKGGSATKKMAMGGGAMDMMMGTPALVGRPAVNAPVRAPGKPSMAMRRKAMMAKPAMPMDRPPMPMGNPNMPAPMKKGGKANFEMSGKDVEKKGMPEGSKADMALDKKQMMGMKKGGMKRMAEGGDMAQDKAMIKKAFKQHDSQEHKGGKGTDLKLKKGGMKKGGMATGGVKNGNGGGYATGGVTNGQGGYATGGVALGNAGGFKSGGKSSKKAYATGGTVNSGRPVAMPQGSKKPSQPVSINRFAGTFKRGGTVKMNGGGSSSDQEKYMLEDPKAVSDKASRELEEALNPLSMVKELYGKARDAFRGEGSVSDKEKSMPSRPKGAVTKTEKSITVTPAGKRRGGVAC